MSNPQQLVQKLWNYCNILRDDGLSYGDYVEQLTFLLFLKMADEQSKPPFNKPSPIPKGFGWDVLLKLDGDDLEIHYRHNSLESVMNEMAGLLCKEGAELYPRFRGRIRHLVSYADHIGWGYGDYLRDQVGFLENEFGG